MDEKNKDGIQKDDGSLESVGKGEESVSGTHDTDEGTKEEKGAEKEPKRSRKGTEKKDKKKEPKEEEDIWDDDGDDEYDDDDDDDDEYEGGSNTKIILVSVLIAALIAAIAIVAYQNFKAKPDAAATTQTELTETETEESTEAAVTEAPETETAAPTATPKPLPSATPLPVTPEPETDSIIPDETETPYTEGTTEDDMSLAAGEGTETAHVILLGDSRFREMANVVSGDAVLWECSATGDYNWLVETAYPDVDSRVGAGTKILINIGINDLNMSQSYAQSINQKAKEWVDKGASVYYVSVGPVAKESAVSNEEIANFNTYMFQNLDKDTIPFIDAYNYLIAQGFTTTGDVYDNATNTALYQYLMDLIK